MTKWTVRYLINSYLVPIIFRYIITSVTTESFQRIHDFLV